MEVRSEILACVQKRKARPTLRTTVSHAYFGHLLKGVVIYKDSITIWCEEKLRGLGTAYFNSAVLGSFVY